MPGILPMKVIKVGTNAQTRIAQACDRCRSKKIRCDGVRPCCSQCANVGFECKTSDKLSRRAFPRGYTESLEERVRGLELEVRELKELLDEKDEKIDMLSRIHSQSSQPIQLPSPRRPSTTSITSGHGGAESPEKDEVFKVQQSPCLLAGEDSTSYFAGTSSGNSFIEAFKRKSKESARSTVEINAELLLARTPPKLPESLPPTPKTPVVWGAPPRLISDQLINIFFQEWAPLFPVLHRPTFLTLYEKYVTDVDSVDDKTEIAQLNLVFAIASYSGGTRSPADLSSFESQWKAAIDVILTDNSMNTLQILILAQIYCSQSGDLTRLLTYKGLSTSLSARLGLHQSQKRFALDTLTCETRKKVFWSLYTVDCFTAVVLGLPKHLKDEDIQCEYPVDADDEYVTEHGFQPTLPGEFTKLSSALALFKAARILSKVLEEVFPAKASYELSMKKISELSDELDTWRASLAPHLRLQFAQDKPSVGTISSRSPLLSLTYHYIRALINRPVVCASLGHRSSSCAIALADSCKHVTQIVQLLEERSMSFSFCLNRDEVLVLSGFGLLFHSLDLDSASKVLKDHQRTITAIVNILKSSEAPCASEFGRIVASFLPLTMEQPSKPAPKPKDSAIPRHHSDPEITINPYPGLPSSTKKQLKAIASRFTVNSKTPKLDVATDHRRATVHNISLHPHGVPSQSQPSLQSPVNYSPASTSRSEPARSPSNLYNSTPSTTARPSAPPVMRAQTKLKPPQKLLNLDYLSFGNDTGPTPARQSAPPPIKSEPQPTEWEKLLGSLDNGTTNIYDACYGGQPVEALLDSPPLSLPTTKPTSAVDDASQAAWNAEFWSLCQTDTNTTVDSVFTANTSSGHADSVLSFSSADDASGRSSGEHDFDWVSATEAAGGGATRAKSASASVASLAADAVRGIVMPAALDLDDSHFTTASWDSGLSL